MIKPRRMLDVADCTVGQLYLLISKYGYGQCKAVRCTALFDNNNMEIDKNGYKSKVDLNSKYSSDHIYEYNASLRLKYNRLLEQHRKELDDLLHGKEVIVYNLSEEEQKEKWYRKLWKKSKKKFRI